MSITEMQEYIDYDAEQETEFKKRSKRKGNSYKRKIEEKRRLNKLYKQFNDRFYNPTGAYYDEEKGRIIRCWNSKNCAMPSYLKKSANKKVRHSDNIGNKGNYKKVYEIQYNIY